MGLNGILRILATYEFLTRCSVLFTPPEIPGLKAQKNLRLSVKLWKFYLNCFWQGMSYSGKPLPTQNHSTYDN
jgi:hypothetical protein